MNTNINIEQINNALFNGNYKLGKLSQGWHKVANVKQRNIDLPEQLPEQAVAFFYTQGNVVLYVANGKLYVNSDSDSKLSTLQQGCVDYLVDNVKLPVEKIQLGWQGKVANGIDRQQAVANKVLSMLA